MPDRNLDDWLREDKTLRRFIELNIEVLSNIAKIGYGAIEHIPIKDGKLLVKKQTLNVSGAE